MRSDQLHCFLALADELNFGRAAERLGVSQSSVSNQIKTLEDELGTRLLERTTRQVRLTSAGAKVLPLARNIVSQMKQVSIAARADKATETSFVIVGDDAQIYADGSADTLIADLPRDILAGLQLRPKAKKGWVSGLIDGNADVAFLNDPPKGQSELRYELVALIPLVFVMTQGHALSGHKALTPKLLAGEKVIVPAEDRIGPSRQAIGSFLQTAAPNIDLVDADHDWATILAMVQYNAGIGMVPHTLSGQNNPSLVFLPPAERAPRLAHYLVWREDERSDHVRRFVDAVLSKVSLT